MRGLLRILRSALAPTKYHAQYACTVAAQSSDWKTLDLVPDDEAIRGDGLKSVEIWHGLPGFDVKVLVGSRVMLGFRDGNSTKPFAALWEPGQVEQVRFMGGEAPVARQGDSVTVFWPSTMEVLPGATIGGNPFVGTIAITTPGVGVIDGGQEKLTA